MMEREWINWREQTEETAKKDSASFRSKYLTLIEFLEKHGLEAVRYNTTAGAFLRELVSNGTLTEDELRRHQRKYLEARDFGSRREEDLVKMPIVLRNWEELSPSDAAILRASGRMGIEYIEKSGIESIRRKPWAKKFEQAMERDAVSAYAVGLAQERYLRSIGEIN